jgi:hypothetical protein
MKGVYRGLIVAILLALATACGAESSETNSLCNPEARTCYEALDLSTPESAVTTFVDAFRREDFQSVWLILSAQAQFIWQQDLRLMQFERSYREDRKGKALEGLFGEGLPWGEHTDAWYVFDSIMLAAKADSALLIDLSGETVIERVEDSQTKSGETAVDVVARVEGTEGEVVFRMTQAPSGRWRVYQVIVPGGDEELVPWAVVNETVETVRIEASAEIEVPCSDDPPSSPEQVSGQPYLETEPTCGVLSEIDETHQSVLGTTLVLAGRGFVPNTETKIWWEDPAGNQFLARQAGEYVIFQTDDQGAFRGNVVMPYAITPVGEGYHTWIVRAVQEVPVTEP